MSTTKNLGAAAVDGSTTNEPRFYLIAGRDAVTYAGGEALLAPLHEGDGFDEVEVDGDDVWILPHGCREHVRCGRGVLDDIVTAEEWFALQDGEAA